MKKPSLPGVIKTGMVSRNHGVSARAPPAARLARRMRDGMKRISRQIIRTAPTAVVALLSLTALGEAAAAPRPRVAVARPFDVGISPAGNYLSALIAGADRDTGAAATYTQEALRSDPRNTDLMERAFIATLANGNMNDAFRLAQRLVQLEPANGLAHLALGVRELKARNFSAARAQFARSGPGRQRDVTANLLTAWSWAGSHRTSRALEIVDTLNDPTFRLFQQFHGGLIADLGKDGPEALKRMQAAYAIEKGTLRLIDGYARFLAERGDRAGARKVYEDFDALLPHHPLVQAAMAQLDQGKPLEPLVRDAVAGAAEVLYGLGAAGGRQGDELAAMVYLRLSLFLTPSNPLATMTLADTYERTKQSERAIDVFETIPKDSPLRSNADVQIALTLEQLGKEAEATKFMQAIVAQRPKDQEALVALGNLQRGRKQFEAAAESYTKALAATEKPEKAQWVTYYFRGITYEREKKWDMAEADFKKALELFPDQPLVLNYLGYSWVDRNINVEEAFKMLRKAVELRPSDGYIVDSLGWAYYRLGRYDEATKLLEQAIDLKPGDPTINDHLGDVYFRIGRKLEAVFQWNHARDLKPEPEDLDKILAKIKDGGIVDEKPASAEVAPKQNGG